MLLVEWWPFPHQHNVELPARDRKVQHRGNAEYYRNTRNGNFFTQEYLMGEPENLLKGKTAVEKLLIVLKYIPMFSLTAFFRVGAGVPKVTATVDLVFVCGEKSQMSGFFYFRTSQVMGPFSNSFTPFSPGFFFFIVWIWWKMHGFHFNSTN